MIHYHGTPVTPEAAAVQILRGRHAMVSFAHPEQIGTIAEICQSVAFDNGAFPFWKSNQPTNWPAYYEWVDLWRFHPCFDFALVPDVIDGDEETNDKLLSEWPLGKFYGCPVWHLHESLDRLARLCGDWPRVALGSSGAYASVGTESWWNRMGEAMTACCDSSGRPICKLHGLRMLNPEVFSRFPFSSADSTNIARNIGIDKRWKGTYQPPNKAIRGLVLAERIEASNSSPVWDGELIVPEPKTALYQMSFLETSSHEQP